MPGLPGGPYAAGHQQLLNRSDNCQLRKSYKFFQL